MKALFVSVAMGAGILLSVGAYADAPAGSTAQCKDGTYYSGTEHKGACRGHKGVDKWLVADAAPAAAAAPVKAAPAAAKPASAAKPPGVPAAAAPAAAPAPDVFGSSSKSKRAKPSKPDLTAAAPAGATARCRDGTFFSGASHSGACRGHRGVQDWLDGSPAPAPKGAAPAVAPEPATSAAPMAPAMPATSPAAATPTAAATETKRTAPTPASQLQQKAGGGPGLVWVNSGSKVYHCQGDEWYGKTKEGSYMSEAAATSAGNHAAHGKACTP